MRPFTPSDLRSGIRSLSSIKPICKYRCPPLSTYPSPFLGPGTLILNFLLALLLPSLSIALHLPFALAWTRYSHLSSLPLPCPPMDQVQPSILNLFAGSPGPLSLPLPPSPIFYLPSPGLGHSHLPVDPSALLLLPRPPSTASTLLRPNSWP